MRSLLTIFAVFALVFAIGCGSGDKDKTDGCGDGCGASCGCGDACGCAGCGDGCGCGDSCGCGEEKAGGDSPPAKTGGDAAKTVTYKCGCGKEKTLAADATAPS